MTRKECLEEAMKCVCGKREQDYGSPEDNFETISNLWTAYLGHLISSKDVSMMMALMKIARIKTGNGTEDSYVDLAGYSACGCEIESSSKSKTFHNLEGDTCVKCSCGDGKLSPLFDKARDVRFKNTVNKVYDMINFHKEYFNKWMPYLMEDDNKHQYLSFGIDMTYIPLHMDVVNNYISILKIPFSKIKGFLNENGDLPNIYLNIFMDHDSVSSSYFTGLDAIYEPLSEMLKIKLYIWQRKTDLKLYISGEIRREE